MRFFLKKIFFLWICINWLGINNLSAIDSFSLPLTAESLFYSQQQYRELNKAIQLLKKGESHKADSVFLQLIEEIKANKIVDKELIYKINGNYALLLKKIGNDKKAIIYLDKNIQFVIDSFGSKSKKIIPIYVNKGNIYFQKYNYIIAQELYEKALMVIGKSKSSWLLPIYNNMGVLNLANKNYKKSLFYYLKALNLKKEQKQPRFSTLMGIASCYDEKGDFKKSNKYYELAIADLKKYVNKNSLLLADYYLNYSAFLNAYNKFQAAYNYIQLAYNIYKKNYASAKHPNFAVCLSNFGDYYRIQGKYGKALEFYQKALIAQIDNFNNTDIYSRPIVNNMDAHISTVEILKPKAFTFVKYYRQNKDLKNLIAALDTYNVVLKLIDKIRIGYQNETSRLALVANEISTYKSAIITAMDLYRITQQSKYKNLAFEYSERAKSANLLSAINDNRAKIDGGLPKNILEKEQNLRKKIGKYRELIYQHKKRNNASELINELKDSLFNLNSDYNQLMRQLETNYPDYYRLKYHMKNVDIRQFQKTLNDENVLIEYVAASDRLIGFFISKEQFIVKEKLIDTTKFYRSISEMRKTITNNSFDRATLNYKKYIKTAYYLYTQLIQPFQSLITGKNITIVPSGEMAYIPFGALLTTKADSLHVDYRNLSYLIKYNSINYSNSIAINTYNRSGKCKLRSTKLLAFAPLYNNLAQKDSVYSKLPSLPGSLKEVNSIADIVNADIYVDSLATERTFKKLANKYDILHLAMHTIIDNDAPMFSKLVFYPEDDEHNGGLLTAQEIYNMKLGTSMVVLSACSSGEGKLLKGEGVMSLARGFFYAGCPSVLMTLWTVEDKSGAKLMTYFYDYLSEGCSKSKALHFAKLAYLKNADPLQAHPYFWSGYVTIGVDSPVFTKCQNQLILLLLVVVCLGMVFYILRKKRLTRVKDKT